MSEVHAVHGATFDCVGMPSLTQYTLVASTAMLVGES
jgi:hypothetical protein